MARPPDSPPVHIPLEGEAEDRVLRYRTRKYRATIDAEDEELVRALGPWYIEEVRGRRRYVLCATGYGPDGPPDFSAPEWVSPDRVYLHDLVMGAGAGELVKALNGNLLDCRKSNLVKWSRERVERERQQWEAHLKQQQQQQRKEREQQEQQKKERVLRNTLRKRMGRRRW